MPKGMVYLQSEHYLLYEEKLAQYIRFNTIVLVVMSAVVIGLVIFSAKSISLKWSVFSLITGAVIVLSVYVITILPIQIDIKGHDYFSYSGEFYVKEHSYGTRRGEYIYIKLPHSNSVNRYKVACDVGNITNETTYMGSFVVANNSKILVDISLE